MTTTAKLGLTDLVEAQGGAETRMNANMRIIDTLLNCLVIDRDLSAPPGSPTEGDTYIVAGSATGDWLGQEGNIAYFNGSVWKFFTPYEGVVVRVADENIRIEYDGSNWQLIPTGQTVQQAIIRLDNPALDDQIPLMFTDKAITITGAIAVVSGSSSPAIDYNIMHNSSRNSAGTQVFTTDPTANSETTGTVSNSGFNGNTIAASRFVWIEIESAPAGTVDWVEIYVSFTEDAV